MSWTRGKQPLWQALDPQADEYREELSCFMQWLIEAEWMVRDGLPAVQWLCTLQSWIATTATGWGLSVLDTVNTLQETVNKLIRLFDEDESEDDDHLLPYEVYQLRLE